MENIVMAFYGIADNGKKQHYKQIAVPMSDEECCPVDEITAENCWAWVCDGEPHKSNVRKGMKYPAIILPRLINTWGNEEDARKIGYKKCKLSPLEPISKAEAQEILKSIYGG